MTGPFVQGQKPRGQWGRDGSRITGGTRDNLPLLFTCVALQLPSSSSPSSSSASAAAGPLAPPPSVGRPGQLPRLPQHPQGPVRSCSQSGLLRAGSSPLIVARWTEASCPTTRRVLPIVHVASRIVNTTCCLGAISHRVVATRFQEKLGPSSPGLDIPGMDTDTAQCCAEPRPPGCPEEPSEDAGVDSGHRFPGVALSNFHPSSLRNSLPGDKRRRGER